MDPPSGRARRRSPTTVADPMAAPAPADRVALAVPRLAWVVVALAGLLLLGILVVLVAVLLSLEGTRSELRTTRSQVDRIDERVGRVGDVVQPLLDVTGPLRTPQARRSLRAAGSTVVAAAAAVPPLAESTRQAAGAATSIAGSLQDADLARSLAAVRTIAGTLRSARLAPALDAVQRIGTTLQAGGRLTRVLRAADGAAADLRTSRPPSQVTCDLRLRTRPVASPGQVACLARTVPNIRLLLRQQRDLTGTSVRTQGLLLDETRQLDTRLETSLEVQQDLDRIGRAIQTIAATIDGRTATLQGGVGRVQQQFDESLGIQRELLAHARSIDAKVPPLNPTGIAAPPTATTPAP